MDARPYALLFALTLGAATFPEPHNNQPETISLLKPADALTKLHLPEGFRATLFAAEPDVRQPIALCWDERGRLWVAENYTYANGKERFDLKLRDRIVIFEDTDHDGVFDQRTVFADDLQMLTSIERGLGGVWAMCPPHLLFIPTDGDKPAGPPQVVLDGFSTTAASRHTFANGLKWGPDGWLYGRVGISSTSWIDVPGVEKDKRQPTAGGLWRYHPLKKIFEPYCHGTTNPWGSDWTKDHELLFINTVIGHGWQGIHGAHFKRMHGEDPYPFVYELIDQQADHYHWNTGKKWNDADGGRGGADDLGGGHAHVGMMVYQGDNWPAAYRDKLMTLNLHGRRVNVEAIERVGSALVMKHQPDILKSADPWFRGIELSQGPDGAVTILDWSDIGECHDEDGIHRTSGRIFKVAYGTPRQPDVDLTKASPTQLVELQRSRNEWLVRMARWELRERAWQGQDLSSALPAWEKLAAEVDPVLALNAHSTLLAMESTRRGHAPFVAQHQAHYSPAAVLAKQRPDVLARLIERELTEPLVQRNNSLVKYANHRGFIPSCDEQENALLQLASQPRGQRVRLALASSLPHLTAPIRTLVAQHLLRYEQDSTDHNLPLLVWTGIRELPLADLASTAHVCRVPQVSKLIARRLAEASDKQPEPLNDLLAGAADMPDGHGLIVAGMADGLKGWRKAAKPTAWTKFVASIPPSETAALDAVRQLNVLFGDGMALEAVRRIALDDQALTEQRRVALRSLIEANEPHLRADCEKLLSVRGVAMEAIQGLTKFDDPAVAKKILARYPQLYPHERPQAIMALVARPNFARELLKAIAEGKVAKADLGSLAARQIRAFNDAALNAQLVAVWGETRETPADKLKLIAELKARHTPDSLAQADVAKGHALFVAVCGQCHKLFGEGGAIGPDLTGSGRRNLDYLLQNIVDPNAVVDAAYYLNTLTLKDGRVLSGIVGAQTERTLTLRSIGQETTLDRADIVQRDTQPISLMPEALLQALSAEQQRDLLAYLMSETGAKAGK
jgi:putative membrane-bound dehydrogenase-like protein